MFVLLLPLPLFFFRASELCTSPCSLLGVLFALFTRGWGGRESIYKEILSLCNVSAPYSSIAVCVSSKATVVAFDFAWVTISLVGCQQHLILGPLTQTLKSRAEEVISLVGSYNRQVLCLDRPRAVPA